MAFIWDRGNKEEEGKMTWKHGAFLGLRGETWLALQEDYGQPESSYGGRVGMEEKRAEKYKRCEHERIWKMT